MKKKSWRVNQERGNHYHPKRGSTSQLPDKRERERGEKLLQIGKAGTVTFHYGYYFTATSHFPEDSDG